MKKKTIIAAICCVALLAIPVVGSLYQADITNDNVDSTVEVESNKDDVSSRNESISDSSDEKEYVQYAEEGAADDESSEEESDITEALEVNIELSAKETSDGIYVSFSSEIAADYYLVEVSKDKEFNDTQQTTTSSNEVTFEDLDQGYNYYIRATSYIEDEKAGISDTVRQAIYTVYNVSFDTTAYSTEDYTESDINIVSDYYCGYYDDDYPEYITVLCNKDRYAISIDDTTKEDGNITILPTGAMSQYGEGVERSTACSAACMAMLLRYEYGLDITKEQVYYDAYEIGLIDQITVGMLNENIAVLLDSELEKYNLSGKAAIEEMSDAESYDLVKEYVDNKLANGHRLIVPVLAKQTTRDNAYITEYVMQSEIRHSVLVVGSCDDYYYVADPYYKENPSQSDYYFGLRKVSCETLINSFENCYICDNYRKRYINCVS